jgi:hypothetical protein
MNALDFVVSPNPANTQFSIQLNQASAVNYKLVDQLGRVVVDGSNNGMKQITLATDQLPAGLYQVIVSDGARQYSRKIVVQH